MLRVTAGRRQVLLSGLLFCLFLLLTGCTTPERHLQRGEAYAAKGDCDHALNEYADAVGMMHDDHKVSAVMVKAGECLFRIGHQPQAVTAFSKAVQIDPLNMQAHVRLSEALVGADNPRALDEAQLVLGQKPDDPDALTVVGTLLAGAGRLSEGEQYLERALASDPTMVNVALGLADIYNAENKVPQARAVLHKVAMSSVRNPLPWMALGRLAEQEGDAEEAEEDYRHAVALDDSMVPNLRLAQFLQRAARVKDAEKVLQHADQLQPERPTSLADFHFISGRVNEAVQSYLGFLKKAPPEPQAQDNMRASVVARLVEADLEAPANAPEQAPLKARLHLLEFSQDLDAVTADVLQAEVALALDDIVLAKQKADSAVKQAPDSAAAHYMLGRVAAASNDMNTAEIEWNVAVQKDGQYAPARLALAKRMLDVGEYPAGEEHVAAVVRNEPGNVRALALYSELLAAEKRMDAARSLAQRAIAVGRNDPAGHIALGKIALAQFMAGQALIEYEEAVLLDPHSDEALNGLTEVYRKGKVTRAMLTHMEKVANGKPASPTLMEIAGRLYRDHRWNADAARCFRRVLELDPQRTTAATALAETYAASGDLRRAAVAAEKTGSGSSALLNGVRAQENARTSDAIAAYELALHHGDTSGVAANNLAWIYASRGEQLDRALELANVANKNKPEDPAVLDTLGYVLLRRRQYSESATVLEHALELANRPNGDRTIVAALEEHLAEAYVRSGRPEAAAKLRGQLRR